MLLVEPGFLKGSQVLGSFVARRGACKTVERLMFAAK
jgi:hypothetical protein